jgi:hypothetical protein
VIVTSSSGVEERVDLDQLIDALAIPIPTSRPPGLDADAATAGTISRRR